MDRAGRLKLLEGVETHYRAYHESAQQRFPAALLHVSRDEKIGSLREIAKIKPDLLTAIRNVASADVAAVFDGFQDADLPYPLQKLKTRHMLYRDVPDKLLREREDFRKAGYVILDHAQSARRHEKHNTMGYVARVIMGDRGILGSASYMSHMEGVFDNARRISEVQAAALGLDTPYDANLMEFTPGVQAAEYEDLLDYTFKTGTARRKEILHEQARQESPLPLLSFTPEQGQKLVDLIGGLLPLADEAYRTYMLTGIPSMCMGNIATVRFSDNPMVLAEATFHERTGHLTYRYNAKEAGGINGFHLDEARALSLERFFLRDEKVLARLSDLMQEAYGTSHEALGPENLVLQTKWIDPGIAERVSSDDLTYLIQESIRGQAEIKVMNGTLAVTEVPDFMAAATEEAFGLSGLNGYHIMRETFQWPLCMQGHMAAYSTGMIIAAQLNAAAKATLGDDYADISRGANSPYFKYMAEVVDEKGTLLSPQDIVKSATGRPLLDRTAFEASLNKSVHHPEFIEEGDGVVLRPLM